MEILIVDDEFFDLVKLDKIIKKIINDCKTYKFFNSLDAFEFAKKNKIDLVFLDITIPLMNGYELARELKKINPEVKICFVSGYDKHIVEGIPYIGYLEKPYNISDVQKIIWKIEHDNKGGK